MVFCWVEELNVFLMAFAIVCCISVFLLLLMIISLWSLWCHSPVQSYKVTHFKNRKSIFYLIVFMVLHTNYHHTGYNLSVMDHNRKWNRKWEISFGRDQNGAKTRCSLMDITDTKTKLKVDLVSMNKKSNGARLTRHLQLNFTLNTQKRT